MPPRSPDQLEADARAAEQAAREHEIQALALREHARLLREASRALTMPRKRSMVGSNVEQNLEGRPENVRTSANRARRQSAARDAMIGGNHVAADLAKTCGVARSTANAWLNGTRAIPEPHLSRLERSPFGIPRASWPRTA